MTDRPVDPRPADPVPAGCNVEPDDPRDDGVPPWLREPAEHSFEAPGQPERELRPARRRRRRRAERSGTNPTAEDLPDVVPPRAPPQEGEEPHERWLREQRPPHWE